MSGNRFNIKTSDTPKRRKYVFFCEGGTEAEFIRSIPSGILQVDLIPANIGNARENNDDYWFTPKRILDYYLKMRNPDSDIDWPYNYDPPSRDDNRNPDIYDAMKLDDTRYCLLIDTDVFFKNINPEDYTNLTDTEIGEFQMGGEDFLTNTFYRNNQGYRFLEQELNFEDFLVLFFIDNLAVRNDWFTRRFRNRQHKLSRFFF